MAAPLSSLLPGIPPALADLPISSIAYDSRRVTPGALFFALPGAKSDGTRFLPEAFSRGASAAVVPFGSAGFQPAVNEPPLPLIPVPNPRQSLAQASDAFFSHPSRRLALVGITGTNGKTTVAWLLRQLANACDSPCALVGTVEYDTLARRIPASRTTPEAPDIDALLAESLAHGARAAAIEISSQGIAADRPSALSFAATVFTNLTGDHLDFHGTMEAYFAAKRRLFTTIAPSAPAIINADCPYGRRLAEELSSLGPPPGGLPAAGRVGEFPAESRLLLFSASGSPSAPIRAENATFTADGATFTLLTPWGTYPSLHLPLPGRHNLANALAAFAAAAAIGLPPDALAAAIPSLSPAPGRLQPVPDPLGTRRFFVDYAHTDDALTNVLSALRPITPGRLICLFGCGGDRDRTKRPRMAAAAARLADILVLTSDNPRTEDPLAILADIQSGLPAPCPIPVHVDPDRASAIALAVSLARPGDTLLVAGKGHEPYQEINGTLHPFSDSSTLASLLSFLSLPSSPTISVLRVPAPPGTSPSPQP